MIIIVNDNGTGAHGWRTQTDSGAEPFLEQEKFCKSSEISLQSDKGEIYGAEQYV